MTKANPSASYSVTMRVAVDNATLIGSVATAVSDAGGAVTALDVVEPSAKRMVVDITCNAIDDGHAELLKAAVDAVEGANVQAISDRTFLLHLGGVISVEPKISLKTRDDLSMAYTPGVARISMAIAKDPTLARNLTIKRNSVAVVTDGSAVLGLGNIGPEAALPVMEGKALLFKRFAGIDAWPVCLATQDVDEIVRIVECIAPVYGGINLEDISAPRCFEVESRLRELLDIPVFHDDQHGTSTVVYAALLNALRVVGKELKDIHVVVLGVGAAGVAISKLLLAEGVGDIVGINHNGILVEGDTRLDSARQWLAANTNSQKRSGTLADAMAGADVLIGVSGSNLVTEEHLKLMAKDSIVFALANPDPEVDLALARRYAAIVASGRSEQTNKINKVIAFQVIFNWLLDVGARRVTEEVEIVAGRAIAGMVKDSELSPEYIVPTVFNANVVTTVAAAVEGALRTP